MARKKEFRNQVIVIVSEERFKYNLRWLGGAEKLMYLQDYFIPHFKQFYGCEVDVHKFQRLFVLCWNAYCWHNSHHRLAQAKSDVPILAYALMEGDEVATRLAFGLLLYVRDESVSARRPDVDMELTRFLKKIKNKSIEK